MPRICLIQPPALLLRDTDGKNRTDALQNSGNTYQPLIGSLEHAGHDVTLLRMRDGTTEHVLGIASWQTHTLTKIAYGIDVADIPVDAFDVFGVTSNFHMERGVVELVTRFLSAQGKPVVVGGSDAIADPHAYINAGATVVVLDKSGGSNAGAIEIALTGTTEKPVRVHTRQGPVTQGEWRHKPDHWPLPSVTHVRDLKDERWRDTLPAERFPMTSLVFDQGCDQACDFCMTRRSGLYGLGYSFMSPETVGRWLDLQVDAGMRTVNSMSDQLLGRVLHKGGRNQVLSIMRAFRERELTWMIRNGLEISKLTRGVTTRAQLRITDASDLTPDYELVNALYGPSNIQSYIPLERPLEGTKRYSKLMQWRGVVEMCKAIVASGAPDLLFGVIIGLKEDSHESLSRLDEALFELGRELRSVNPNVRMSVNPTVIILFPGIPLTEQYKELGLMPRDPDPAIVTKYTPLARTDHLSIDEVLAWQKTLYEHHVDGDRWGNRGATAYST